MRLFGRELKLSFKRLGPLQSVDNRGGWWPILHESDTGAWQSNTEVRLDTVLTHPTVFACITLIAGDMSKLDLCLTEETDDGIWIERESPAFSPVIRKPNHFQTINKFVEQWLFSKLIWGNAYALKQRDARGVVTALYLLDPNRVRPLVAEDGSVYYDLMRDTLSGLTPGHIVAPAREIMHDPMWTFYHPLVGLPPLYASGLLATLGINIVRNSAQLFANSSQPGGILTARAGITDVQATALKTAWETAFGGDNYGKVAVLGGDLKFELLSLPSDKTQTIEQWGKTSEAIATTFHVPFHLVGGPPPPYNNIQALQVQYLTQCLQALIDQFEAVFDEGLGLGPQFGNRYGVEFDIDDLLWMDSLTMMSVIKEGVGAGVFSPNEGRQMRNLPPAMGGESPYLQQQNYSLEALSKRDASGDPFGTASAQRSGVEDVTPSPAPAAAKDGLTVPFRPIDFELVRLSFEDAWQQG